MIKDNVETVWERIGDAAKIAGRPPENITLIAVSKNFGVESILEAIKAGVTDFGENRVQEAASKIDKVDADIKWHLIGHLQSNKAKAAAGLFDVIHSVDSVRLAGLLNVECAKLGKKLDVFLQVNIAGEEVKSGVTPMEAPIAADRIIKLENLNLIGLMTIPPYFEDSSKVRPFYAKLRELKDKINARLGKDTLSELSMGMSDDYDVAIQEGATYVRVGTAIFGRRNYK